MPLTPRYAIIERICKDENSEMEILSNYGVT